MDDLESSDPGGSAGVPIGADDALPEDTEVQEPGPEYEEMAEADAVDAELDASWRAGLSWARLSVTLGLGVVGVQAMYVIFTIAQGLTLHRKGSSGFDGDFFHRLGIACSQNFNALQGLALVVAVALVSLPSIVDVPLSSRYELRRLITLWTVGVLAIVVGVGAGLGVRAEFRLDAIRVAQGTGAGTTTFRRWALATDVVGTLGMALLAFLAALAAFPDRRSAAEPETRSEPTAAEEPRS